MEQVTILKFVFEDVTVISDSSAYTWADRPWRFVHASKERQSELDALAAELWRAEPQQEELHHRQIADVVRYLSSGGRPAEVTAEKARSSIDFITRMYQSAFTNRRVDSAVERDSPFYASMNGGYEIR